MSMDWFRRKPKVVAAPVASKVRKASAVGGPLAGMPEVEAAMGKGQFEQAREMLEAHLAANSRNVDALILLAQCLVRMGDFAAAKEPLFTAIELRPQSVVAYKSLIGILIEERDLESAHAVVQKAIALDPQDAELSMMAGDICTLLGRFEDAAVHLLQAFARKPDDHRVLQLMEAISENSTFRPVSFTSNPRIAAARERAIRRLQQAMRKHGLDAQQLTFLLTCLAATKDGFAAAAKLADEVLAFDPMTRPLARQLIDILRIGGDAQKWLHFSERLFAADPDNPEAKFALASSRIASGDEHWAAGWRVMTESNLRFRTYTLPPGLPIWEGQRLGKNKVLVFQDQGAGDAVLGFRFLPLLRARGIEYEVWVHPKLAGLVAQVPGVGRVVQTKRLPNPAEHGCACASSFFGLISALYLSPEEIRNPPIVTPDPEHARALRDRVSVLPGVRIGLLFGGNPQRRDDWVRSVPADVLERLGKLSGVSWVSLMVDDRPDKARVEQALHMIDGMQGVDSFYDTAAVIGEVDAVVAVDASVAHVAACLGKPVWVLAPTICDWRWQIGSQLSPWWPTARVLRSEAPGVWAGALDNLLAELEPFVAQRQGAGRDPLTV